MPQRVLSTLWKDKKFKPRSGQIPEYAPVGACHTFKCTQYNCTLSNSSVQVTMEQRR